MAIVKALGDGGCVAVGIREAAFSKLEGGDKKFGCAGFVGVGTKELAQLLDPAIDVDGAITAVGDEVDIGFFCTQQVQLRIVWLK